MIFFSTFAAKSDNKLLLNTQNQLTMRKLILFLGIALALACTETQAQTPVSYEYVIQKDGATAEQIYSTLVDWVVTSFKAVDGDFYRDKEEKVITKDALFDYEATRRITACYGGHISYKLKFQCRDGRFKMMMVNFEHHNAPGNAPTCVLGPITDQAPDDRFAKEIWNDIRQKIDAYAADMKGQMERLPMNTANDDW